MCNNSGSDKLENRSTQHSLHHCENGTNCQPEQSARKERTGILGSLFGVKKCKFCSRKKSFCSCKASKKYASKTTQSDCNVDDLREEITRTNDGNERGTSRETMCENCLTNCALPSERNGVGFHFYFNIDSKHNRTRAKRKLIKLLTNENVNTKTYTKRSTDCDESKDFACEGPKITIVCDANPDTDSTTNSGGTLSPEIKQTDLYDKRLSSMDSELSIKPDRRINRDSPIETVYHVQNIEQNNTPFEEQPGGVTTKQVKSKESLKENEEKRNLNISKSNDLQEKVQPEVAYRVSYAANYSDSLKLSGNANKKAFQNYGEIPFEKRKSVAERSLDAEEGVFKELEKYRRSIKLRKSTAKSVTSIRQRRQSQMESDISAILRKVNIIEVKVQEIENSRSDTDKITMGISCDTARSNVAIQFNKEKPNERDTPKDGRSMNFRSSKEITNKAEEVKFQNVQIVDSPRKTQDPIWSPKERRSIDNVKSVLHHNAYEIDAHILGSNSKFIKCKNPKIFIKCPKQQFNCKGPKLCDQWRRISEELKISTPDVRCCAECSCKKQPCKQ